MRATRMVSAVIGALVVGTIVSSSNCPSAAAVEDELDQLQSSQNFVGKAELSTEDRKLRLILRDDHSEIMAARDFDLGLSCDQRTRTAALVLSAWQAHFQALVVGGIALPPSSVPSPKPSIAAQVPSAPAMIPLKSPSPALTAAVSKGPSNRTRVLLDYDIGLAAIAAVDGNVAPGARVDGSLTKRGDRFAAYFALFGLGERNFGFVPGTVNYTRVGAALGPRARFSFRRFFLDLHVEADAALTLVEGNGFQHSRRSFSFDPGLGGGMRLGRGFGKVAPYVLIDATFWPRQQLAAVDNVSGRPSLPKFDVMFGIGVAFGNHL